MTNSGSTNATRTSSSDTVPASSDIVPAVTLVIFGAAGDLTKRLIMPALRNLTDAGSLSANFSIIGVDRNERSIEAWRDELTGMRSRSEKEKGENTLTGDDKAWSWLMERLDYVQGDFTDPKTFSELKDRLSKATNGKNKAKSGNVLFYLAVADRFFCPVIEQIGAAGLAQQSDDGWRRVIIEKPFGHDLASAKALNDKILKILSEDQIYRIDHFLGKEPVQNILVMRFANGIFEPMWTRDHIDNIQITAAETVGVEARGNFYEKTGALRDMVPNHLFQLMAMIAMEPPVSFDADAVRAKKTELFKAIHPIPAENAVRGQYRSGTRDGKQLRGYRDEPDVESNSTTETFVALKLGIDNWRWAGVPFYLRTGKNLAAHVTEISVQFRQAPYALFRDTPVDQLPPNILTLRIQPDEGLSASFNAKQPGNDIKIAGVEMNFSYRDFFPPLAAIGYETLLYDCMIGDPILFQRADTVEAAWAAVQSLLDAWTKAPTSNLHDYPAGSDGPDAANRLLARDGRTWIPVKPHKPPELADHTADRANAAPSSQPKAAKVAR